MKTISIFKKRLFILFFCLLNICFSHAQQIKDTTVVIYFDNNKYSLTSAGKDKLDSFFLSHPFTSIKNMSGYADSVGSSPSNLVLSGKRNKETIDFLKKYFPANQNYGVKNFGEAHPASKTDNALNRRVEIQIQYEDKQADSAAMKNEQSVIKKIILDKLYFKPDLPVLENFSLDYLKSIAAVLKTYTDAKFEIRGHVNCPLNVPANSGFMQSMNKLSEDRAKTVFGILKDNGIPEEKMTYKGMGNTQMINPYAKTDEEKRENMRVEIIVMNAR